MTVNSVPPERSINDLIDDCSPCHYFCMECTNSSRLLDFADIENNVKFGFGVCAFEQKTKIMEYGRVDQIVQYLRSCERVARKIKADCEKVLHSYG